MPSFTPRHVVTGILFCALPLMALSATAPVVTSNATTSNGTVSGNTTSAAATATVRTPAADAEWSRITASLKPATVSNPGVRKSAPQITAERNQQAARLQATAVEARQFHTRYASSPDAAKARKLEVVASLESVRLGNTALESNALALATTYRADLKNLREDRFEVALAADRHQLRKKLGDGDPHASPLESEAMADKLRKEFGDMHAVFGLYTGIAAGVDMHSANRIATKILEMRPPPFARAEAQAITSRYGLVGHPLRLQLTTVEGQRVELPTAPAPAGPTVLYVWTSGAAGAANPFLPLAGLKRKLPNDVRWIYLGLPASGAQATAARLKAPFPGLHCVDDAGPRSALAQRLKAHSFPMIFVLDGKGLLTGFGRVDELPTLLAAAQRQPRN